MKLKILILDVDGTLTDGKIYMGVNGEIMKAFSTKDAVGVRKLPKYNVTPIIITGRESQITINRAMEIGIKKVYQNELDKPRKIDEIVKEKKINYNEIGYIGDDENDLEAMKLCGFCACPKDAIDLIKKQCNYVSSFEAGNGAVRDVIEYLIKNNLI